MTLTLLRSLVRNKGYNEEDVIKSYLRWANSKNMGMGTNTRRLLYGIKTVNGFRKRWHKFFDQDDVPESNGCLMRCSPLALLFDPDSVIADCELTNPISNCKDACQVYILALNAALRGGTKNDILEVITSNIRTPILKATLMHVIHPEGVDPDFQDKENKLEPYHTEGVEGKGKGWVIVSLYVALRSFFLNNSYKEAIDFAISMGGDTDTNAAITGALAGAYYGEKAMMDDQIVKNNWETIKKINTNQGDFPRPLEYLPYDLDELIKEAVEIFPLK